MGKEGRNFPPPFWGNCSNSVEQVGTSPAAAPGAFCLQVPLASRSFLPPRCSTGAVPDHPRALQELQVSLSPWQLLPSHRDSGKGRGMLALPCPRIVTASGGAGAVNQGGRSTWKGQVWGQKWGIPSPRKRWSLRDGGRPKALVDPLRDQLHLKNFPAHRPCLGATGLQPSHQEFPSQPRSEATRAVTA